MGCLESTLTEQLLSVAPARCAAWGRQRSTAADLDYFEVWFLRAKASVLCRTKAPSFACRRGKQILG